MRPTATAAAILLALPLMTSAADSAAITKLNAAITAAKNGDNAQALTLLSDAISSGDLSGEDLAVAYYDRGMIYRAQNDNAMALADSDMAIKLNPKYGDAYNLRVGIHMANGESDKAIEDMTALLAFDPQNPVAHANLASAYNGRALKSFSAGQKDKAIVDLGEAIRLNPETKAYYANRANIYLSTGRYDLAVGDFDVVIKTTPDDASALVGRGNAYAKLGKPELAKADFDAAKTISPGDAAMAGRALGDADMAKRDYAKAVSDYTTALQSAPNDVPSLMNRGAAYHNLKQFDKAIADYTAALKLTPNDARLYNNRGSAYAAERKLDQAIADYDEALRIDPNNADAKRNREGTMKAKATGKAVSGK